jgi:acyl dehydratase
MHDVRPAPMYFDDFPVGWTHETGAHLMTEAEIMDYARRWDPQPFHIDPEAARETIYGGIIASGWHTLAVAFRLWYDTELWAEASMGSPGMDTVRWVKPVRPGDAIRVRITVTASAASRSRPDRGRMTARSEILNQADETVAEYSGVHILKRR